MSLLTPSLLAHAEDLADIFGEEFTNAMVKFPEP
jgi:hypothetical protein